DLFAYDVVGDPGPQVVLEAIGEGDDHIVDAPVFDQLAEQLSSFGAVVLTQEIPHHVQGEIAGKVDYRVIQKIGDQLFHRETSTKRGCDCGLGQSDELRRRSAHIADKHRAQAG